jgi:hypothetical protein
MVSIFSTGKVKNPNIKNINDKKLKILIKLYIQYY